jgi:hypothetical protein
VYVTAAAPCVNNICNSFSLPKALYGMYGIRSMHRTWPRHLQPLHAHPPLPRLAMPSHRTLPHTILGGQPIQFHHSSCCRALRCKSQRLPHPFTPLSKLQPLQAPTPPNFINLTSASWTAAQHSPWHLTMNLNQFGIFYCSTTASARPRKWHAHQLPTPTLPTIISTIPTHVSTSTAHVMGCVTLRRVLPVLSCTSSHGTANVPGGLRGAVRQQFLPSSTAKGAAVAGGHTHLHYLTGSRKHGGEVPRRCCRIGETSWVVVSNYENESRMQLGHRH